MSEERNEHIPTGNCEICLKPTVFINILPIKRPDGSLITLACQSCTDNTDVYCKKHERVHLGFIDTTTACAFCIEERVKNGGPQIHESFSRALQESPGGVEIRDELMEWASLSSQITGNPEDICIARAIVTVSERKNLTVQEVITETLDKGFDYLLT